MKEISRIKGPGERFFVIENGLFCPLFTDKKYKYRVLVQWYENTPRGPHLTGRICGHYRSLKDAKDRVARLIDIYTD